MITGMQIRRSAGVRVPADNPIGNELVAKHYGSKRIAGWLLNVAAPLPYDLTTPSSSGIFSPLRDRTFLTTAWEA